MLAIRCTMDEYASHPDRESRLTEAHALHKKASAALEAAQQLPGDTKDLAKFRKALWTVVCSGIVYDLKSPSHVHPERPNVVEMVQLWLIVDSQYIQNTLTKSHWT